jgi:hypothetical protein
MLAALSSLTARGLEALLAVGRHVDTVRIALSEHHRCPQLYAALSALITLLPQLRRIALPAGDAPDATADEWQLAVLRLAAPTKRAGICFVSYPSPAIQAQLALPAAQRDPCMSALIATDEEWAEWGRYRRGGLSWYYCQ